MAIPFYLHLVFRETSLVRMNFTRWAYPRHQLGTPYSVRRTYPLSLGGLCSGNHLSEALAEHELLALGLVPHPICFAILPFGVFPLQPRLTQDLAIPAPRRENVGLQVLLVVGMSSKKSHDVRVGKRLS